MALIHKSLSLVSLLLLSAASFNIQQTSTYLSFASFQFPFLIFQSEETIYYHSTTYGNWVSSDLNFENVEEVPQIQDHCPSYATYTSAGNLACVNLYNLEVTSYNPAKEFQQVGHFQLSEEVNEVEELEFEGDLLFLYNDESDGAVYNLLTEEELYMVEMSGEGIEGSFETVLPEKDALYLVLDQENPAGLTEANVLSWSASNPNSTFSIDISILGATQMQVLFALNQSSVFLGYLIYQAEVGALIGMNLTSKSHGTMKFPGAIATDFIQVNDTHVAVLQGEAMHSIVLYYVGSDLSIQVASTLKLEPYFLVDNLFWNKIEGTNQVIISDLLNFEGQFISVIADLELMKIIDVRFISTNIYPSKMTLNNGSTVYFPTGYNGYFISNPGALPTLVQNKVRDYYVNPIQSEPVYGLSVNSQRCIITEFQPSGISAYQYSNCNCSSLTAQISLQSVVGTLSSSNFSFAYICEGVYVNQAGTLYGPFQLPQNPNIMINSTHLNIISSQTEAIFLSSSQFNNPHVANVETLATVLDQQGETLTSKISEDIAMFVYGLSEPHQSVISVYQISTAKFLQNITFVNPQYVTSVYPFQVKLGSPEPLQLAIVFLEIGPPMTITSQGETTELEEGEEEELEYIATFSENSIAILATYPISGSACGPVNLITYEANVKNIDI